MKQKRGNIILIKIGLSILVLISIYLLIFLFNPFGWKEYFQDEPGYIVFDIIMTYLLSWGIVEFSFLFFRLFEYFLPWDKSPILRFIVQTISIIFPTIILLCIQIIPYSLFFPNVDLPPNEYLQVYQLFIITIIISLFVTTLHTAFFLLNKWRVSALEASRLLIKNLELKDMAMQAEIQSLKLQLYPHFMFNKFCILSELINENPETAKAFLKNLTRVYRYLIQNLKKDIIPLEDEIRFIEVYYNLIKICYADNVIININIDEEALKLYVPPISVQLLVENVIKYNIATKDQPLCIEISSEGNSLEVVHNLQRISKLTSCSSTKIELQNLKERYKLLSEVAIPKVEENEHQFKVTLTLIDFNIIDNESTDYRR